MPPKQKLGFAENFALSGAAAVISKTVAAPIERVKLLVQNQSEILKSENIKLKITTRLLPQMCILKMKYQLIINIIFCIFLFIM